MLCDNRMTSSQSQTTCRGILESPRSICVALCGKNTLSYCVLYCTCANPQYCFTLFMPSRKRESRAQRCIGLYYGRRCRAIYHFDVQADTSMTSIVIHHHEFQLLTGSHLHRQRSLHYTVIGSTTGLQRRSRHLYLCSLQSDALVSYVKCVAAYFAHVAGGRPHWSAYLCYQRVPIKPP